MTAYTEHVFKLEQWCKTSSLFINVGKTKELILNQTGVPTLLTLTNQNVDIVKCFKYLGTTIDDKLNFTENADALCKKASQRLFLIRKLKSFGVSCNILERAYVSLIAKHPYLQHLYVVWSLVLSQQEQTNQNC